MVVTGIGSQNGIDPAVKLTDFFRRLELCGHTHGITQRQGAEGSVGTVFQRRAVQTGPDDLHLCSRGHGSTGTHHLHGFRCTGSGKAHCLFGRHACREGMQQTCGEGITGTGGVHCLDRESGSGDAARLAVAAGAMLALGHNQILGTCVQQGFDGGLLGIAAGEHLCLRQVYQQVVRMCQHGTQILQTVAAHDAAGSEEDGSAMLVGQLCGLHTDLVKGLADVQALHPIERGGVNLVPALIQGVTAQRVDDAFALFVYGDKGAAGAVAFFNF